MERTTAIRTLGKLLGKHLAYRVDPKAPSSEEREAARTRSKELVDRKAAAHTALMARREALLQDPEYQSLMAAWREADKALSHNSGVMHHYKITVGTTDNLFFHVRAQGDNWEEVITKVKAKGV